MVMFDVLLFRLLPLMHSERRISPITGEHTLTAAVQYVRL